MNRISKRHGVQFFAGLIIFISLTACQESTHFRDNATSTAQPKSSQATFTTEELAHDGSSTPIMSADGRHMWIVSTTSPVDELRKQSGQGYERILGVTYGNGRWVSTLLRDNREIQYVDTFSTLKENDLNALIDRGLFISGITWGDEIWLVTDSTTNKPSSQKIIISAELPVEDLNSDQRDGYYVTSITFGEGKWVVVLTQDHDITDQKIIVALETVDLETILNESDASYFVSAVAEGNDQIIIVKSSFQSFTEQEIIVDDSFQKDFIQDAWFNRYDNIRVFFLNNKWVHVVMK